MIYTSERQSDRDRDRDPEIFYLIHTPNGLKCLGWPKPIQEPRVSSRFPM